MPYYTGTRSKIKFYVTYYFESGFNPFSAEITDESLEAFSMKFNRKLIKRSGLYGSITIPPEVLSAWTAVDQVEMTFDGTCLVITPILEIRNDRLWLIQYWNLNCVVALRCDHATKESLENMADARNTTVSRLVFGLIRDGAKLERERRERLRQLGYEETRLLLERIQWKKNQKDSVLVALIQKKWIKLCKTLISLKV